MKMVAAHLILTVTPNSKPNTLKGQSVSGISLKDVTLCLIISQDSISIVLEVGDDANYIIIHIYLPTHPLTLESMKIYLAILYSLSVSFSPVSLPASHEYSDFEGNQS